jgi:hypothetical protein
MTPSTVPKPRRLLRGADVGYALTFRSWKMSEKSREGTPERASPFPGRVGLAHGTRRQRNVQRIRGACTDQSSARVVPAKMTHMTRLRCGYRRHAYHIRRGQILAKLLGATHAARDGGAAGLRRAASLAAGRDG